jgi:hypothetical protein
MAIVDPFRSQQAGGIVDPFKVREEREEPAESEAEKALRRSTIGSELVRGGKQLVSSTRSGIGSVFTPEESAKAGVARSEAIAKEAGEGVSFDALKRAYEKEGLLGAAGEVASQVPRALAGQGANLAAMAGGARLGAMAGTAVAPGLGTVIGGALGAGATLLPQFMGANVERQAAEQMEAGKDVSIDRTKAYTGAAAQAAVESAGTAFVLGKRVVKGVLGIADDAALQTAKSQAELVKTAGRSLAAATGRGAVGGAVEIPVEVSQQIIERYQAGLDLMSPEAFKEYGESAYQAILVGGPLGGFGGAMERGGARNQLKAQQQLKESLERETPSWVKKDLEGETDVVPPITEPSGESTSVVSKPGAGITAPGAGDIESGRVVSTGQDVADIDAGAPSRAGALTNFADAYSSLREELVPLLGGGIQTPEKTAQIKVGMRDLNRMVDEHAALINDNKLIEQLKNPMFDGTSVLGALASQEQAGQPLAMQGDLFGKFINGSRAAQLAVAYAGSPEAAIKFLQDRKQKLLDDLASGNLDAAWAQNIGPRYGMTQGQSIQNYQKVAELYTQSAVAEAEAAIDQVSKQVGAPKAMQGDLFGGKQEAPAVQAPQLVNNGRTMDLVVNGEVVKTYDLVSQGLWDAYKGKPDSQENLLQNQGPRQIRSEAIEALEDARRVYSEQAPLSSAEQKAITALENNDTAQLKLLVQNQSLRDSFLRMISWALSFPGESYRGFRDLEAASVDDPRAALTAQNILRYAPAYMLEGAAIPEKFKTTPKAMQSNLFGEGQSKDEAVKPIAAGAETTDMFGADKTPDIGNRDENLTFENQAAFDAYQARLKRSKQAEERNKAQAGVVSPTMTPQERLDVLTARETDLIDRLEKAKTQKIGSSVGASEESIKQGLQNELNAVRREIRVAQTEAAIAKPAPAAPATKVVAPEQVDMFGKPVETAAPVEEKPKKAEKSQKQERKEAKRVADEMLAEERDRKKEEASLLEDADEFAAEEKDESRLTDAEVAQQAAMDEQRREAKETVKAPKEDTEHVFETKEAKLIKRFLDFIKPATKPGSEEAQKHTSLKDVIYKMLAGFDIVKPGETTTPGMQSILGYLQDTAGGKANFEKLVSFLETAESASQSDVLKESGFPDLTTRRGMETFSKDVKRFINSLGAEKLGGQGVKIPFAKLPYETEVTGTTKKAVTPPVTSKGELRRPSMKQEGKPYKISDTKLRGAWTTLKQMFESRSDVSPEMEAARSYITNPSRKSFGFVLADLAHDIANWDAFLEAKYGMRAADVKEMTPAERNKLPQTEAQAKMKTDFGRNATFYGEGGAYAESFQRWIEQNLDPKTVAALNSMIADERANLEEEAKFDQAVTAYRAEIKRRQAASAEAKIKKAETASGVKIPRAPKQKRTRSEVIFDMETQGEEAITETPVDLRNIPTKAKLHPSVVRALKGGDLKGALEILANTKAEGFYKHLAQRLLDAKLTAKVKIVPKDSVQSLSNDPKIKETLEAQIRALDEMVRVSLPESQQKELIAGLRSKNLYDIAAAVEELQTAFTNPSQRQVVADTVQLMNEEFSWFGKYDPATDTITLREGSLDNNVLLHEALHAATSHLIDNPDKLQGVRKEAYNQLLDLYNHSKGILSNSQLGIKHIYGLNNLHEFVSEAMTNPEFQAMLRAIRYKAAPYSLWNEFTKAIKKLFKVESETDSDVLVEVMKATDAMVAGPMSIDGMDVKSTPKAMTRQMIKAVPTGAANTPTAINKLMTSRSWNEVRGTFPIAVSSAAASARPALLGALTLRQISDLVRNRIPQVQSFIRKAEDFLARKNGILQESGDIAKRWERLQSAVPEASRTLARVMHAATILEIDPDKTPRAKIRALSPELEADWVKLDPIAKQIYRDVRDFYNRRYEEYKQLMNRRITMMRNLGVSETTILEIRNEFEKNKRKGPYFPLMRHGRFWYQIGEGKKREYYMFETQGQKEMHMAERLARNPELEDSIKEGSEYAQQMDLHAKQSVFLKNAFEAIDSATFAGNSLAVDMQKQELKDSIYQNFLANQPEHSFRSQFMHRNNVAGYSEDALRNFSSSSFHMAYQLARFEYAPELFSSVQAARSQIKDRIDAGAKRDPKLSRENTELSDYVTEMDRRLKLMLNPTNIGTLPSLLSNIGFIWYLTAPASAIVNVLGGMIIGLPTLVGMNVRMNPGISYTKATLDALGYMKQAAGQIISTGFGVERGERLRDNRVLFPTLSRFDGLSSADKQAYNRFVADGVIDITAAYDQSGLAAAPTESYGGIRNRSMEVLTSLFHNAERFNREIMAMSAFRAAMDKRKDYKNREDAFNESIAEAKDVTNRSMFDYSATNKPRYFQHPIASVILQFKQFPQQMTFFLAHNAYNMFKGLSPTERREARARFVGTMGMAGIFSGITGLWGFSTVAAVINAVFNGLGDEDEEPFDFELEFMRWATDTFGKNLGTLLTRGVGNAAGIDLASRTKLDEMWFRDSRKNQDEVEALQSFLVDLLGPTVGLTVNVAQASKLLNDGHADRALEMIMPAFIKNPLVAARYADEGVNTLRGDPLMEEMGPFYLLMQSIGLRSSELAERQWYNIQVKGQEQDALKKRQDLLNLYGISFMSNDSDSFEKAMDKIFEFNEKYPNLAIPAESLNRSIKDRLSKSAQTENGLFIDKRMRGLLAGDSYLD